MVASLLPSEVSSLQSVVEFEKLLHQEIEDSQLLLKRLRQQKKYTRNDLSEIKKTEKLIQDNKYLLSELKSMHSLQVGNWVQNGSSTPGEIVDLEVNDRKPQVKVRWWEQEKIESYSPVNLKVLSDRDLRFEWHEKKLVRRCDRFECNDPETLKTYSSIAEQDLERAKLVGQPKATLETYKQEIAYCEKRIKLLSGKGVTQVQEQTILRLFGSQKEEKKLQRLPITQIRRNPVCQQREELDLKVVEDYKEAFLQNIKLPPVKVKFDGSNYWLYDGFHTTEAAIQAFLTELTVEVTSGTLRDAILASVGVNYDHGLRRSNQTKRNAVMVLLQDEEWRIWSNRKIARRCNVSESLVRDLKKDLEEKSTTEDDNSIITAFKRSDNPKKYIDKYGNESMMEVKVKKDSVKSQSNLESSINEDACAVRTEISSPISKVEFLPNQLFKLQLSDLFSAPVELKNRNHRYCVVERKSDLGNSYYVRFLETNDVFLVLSSDLVPVNSVQITLTYTPTEYLNALNCYGTRDKLESAIKKLTQECDS
jgi:hypothetical protein